MFVVFGSLLTLDGLFGDGWAAVAIVAVTLLIARPVGDRGRARGTRAAVLPAGVHGVVRPKGVATMTFSLLVLGRGFPAERIFNLAALCVFASILAHGLTDTPGRRSGSLNRACCDSVQRRLLLGARERPGGLAPALLAEHEAQLRGGCRPSGVSGRKVVHGSSSSSAQRPWRAKKQSSHVIFCALLALRVAATADTLRDPFFTTPSQDGRDTSAARRASARAVAAPDPQNAGCSRASRK